MRMHHSLKALIPLTLALALPRPGQSQSFNPVPLTQQSYTYSIVVPAATVQPVPYCVNGFVGSGQNFNDNTLYEEGLETPIPGATYYNSGVPIHNTVFTNVNDSNMTFLMPPTYTANDDLMIVNGGFGYITSGTFTLNTPTTAPSLALLDTGGANGCTVNWTVTYQDGIQQTGSLSVSDWFNGGSTVAWGCNGREDSGGDLNNNNGSAANNQVPYLYADVIQGLSTASPIVSIAFSYSSGGGVDNFFAVSASTDGVHYTPAPVTGFNNSTIIPNTLPFPVTATMDSGTNLANPGNTWFESGYYAGGSSGLPPSGSTFSSYSQPGHTYEMGNYSTNDAILIDTNHLSANVTPVTPSAYYGLSFLTAGANIGGSAMTNLCIIQHADGVNETNLFYGYDWFNTSRPGSIAWQSNGRLFLNSRSLNNINNNGLPYLFESYFILNDYTSPVTNIIVRYFTAPSANSTTYVMAVSGADSGIAPLILAGPSPTNQILLAGQTATLSVEVDGTAPITNSWLIESNGVYVPLSNGVQPDGSIVYGAGTEDLIISNVTAVDSTNFEYVASNADGSQTGTATVEVFAPGTSLTWDANVGSGSWDTGSTPDWTNLITASISVFNTGNEVLFDDTPNVATSVDVNGIVSPYSITVNSSTNDFTITGVGSITGPGSLLKEGTSSLVINCSGGLSGSVNIQGGSVDANNNFFSGVSSITVTNNSTLDFGGSGFRSITPVTVSGSGLNGEGALYNSDDNYPSELVNITLSGNTYFSGAKRWDLASGSILSGPYYVTMDWSHDSDNQYAQWNSVTIGSNVAGIIVTNSQAASVGCNLGLTGMDSSFKNPTTVLTMNTNCSLIFYGGGFNGSLHLLNGSSVAHLTAPAGFYGSSIVMEGGSTFKSYGNSGQTTPVDSAITLNGVVHFVIGDHYMDYTNVISGVGGFVEDYYNNEMVFSASNTYSGPTIIGSSGNTPQVALTGNGSITHSPLIFFGGDNPTVSHIDVSGRSDRTFTLVSGQTLEGVGGITGGLVESPGSTISPGGTNTTIGITTGANATGVIAASANVTLNGTTMLKLDGTTNDMIEAGGTIYYGGTLNLSNISGTALAAGSSFQVFNAAVYSGSFTAITLPTLGAGLAWNTNQLNSSGVISVVSTSGPVISGTVVSGGNLVFNVTGGAAGDTLQVLTRTNLLLGSWAPIATGVYGPSGRFSFTNAVSPTKPQQYFMIEGQ